MTPWTAARQAPLSMEFSRPEYWSGLPFPFPGDLPDPGIKPRSPTLQVDSLPSEPPGKPRGGGWARVGFLPNRAGLPLPGVWNIMGCPSLMRSCLIYLFFQTSLVSAGKSDSEFQGCRHRCFPSTGNLEGCFL